MTFLTTLAFLLSMIFSEPLIGAAICLTLWGAQVLRMVGPFDVLPNLLALEAQPWLWLSALLCVGVAVWLAGSEERRLTRNA
jgi:Mg2+/citrate symporter